MHNEVFPIPLNDDCTRVVKVAHIPHDLTKSEADKICAIIRALVQKH